MVEFEIGTLHNPTATADIRVPSFNRADYKGLNTALNGLTLKEGPIHEVWTHFKDQFITYQNRFIPLVAKKTNFNKKAEWFNKNISRALRNRNRLYKLKKAQNDQHIVTQYNEARRTVKREIRKAKINYEEEIAKNAKNNPKKFYKYINNKKELKSGIGPLANETGELVSDNKIMADTLNNYFSTVFTVPNKNNNQNTEKVIKSQSNLPSLKITEKQVLNKIEKLKLNKSPGPR